MSLEDFFTLTELKDGLTTTARVNELVTVMQKEKDCVVKNVGEAIRQWSTVASTIAATENRDCLDFFIQLDGLGFIDWWLKDAQKFGNDTGNSFVEESITALLRALERLQIDNHKSVNSGVGVTVKNLLGHSSSSVRDMAKILCDSWTPIQDDDAAKQEAKNLETPGEVEVCPTLAVSPSSQSENVENLEQSRDEKMLPACSGPVAPIQQGRANKEQITTPDNPMDTTTAKADPLDPVGSSSMPKYGGSNLSVNVETPKSKLEGTSLTGACGLTPTVQRSTGEGQSDVSKLDKHVEDVKEKHHVNSLDKANAVAISALSSLPSSADPDKALESVTKTDSKKDMKGKDEDIVDDGASPGHCRSPTIFKTRNQDGVSGAAGLQDSPGIECKQEAENPKTSSNIESDGKAGEVKKHVGRQKENSGNASDFYKPSMNARGGGAMSRRSDMELDYGIVDPLEVARQVAIEVEREVDSREQSCSTSEKISGGGIERPNSPDSTNGKEHQHTGGSGKEVSSGPGPSPRASPSTTKPVNDAEAVVSERENFKTDVAASQISEVAQESEANTEKGFSGFDLNQEVCSEEIDRPTNPVSTPISVVSASRAAAAAGLPVAPLQFEGSLGWKGSAATSAFRRIPEGDKTSFSGTRSNSKQRLDCLDFDLNVAEGSEDKVEDFLSRNKIPITSGLPSGEESSVEASPRRSERLQLDLNSLGDGSADAVVLDWRRDGRVASLNQNGRQSPSRSSSSSSMQPSLRNIDLNLTDQPVFPNDAPLDRPYLGNLFNNSSAAGGVYKREESVISLFGTQVEVKGKDAVSQPNGRISEPLVDFSLGRTGPGLGLGPSMHYANPPVYGHNGFASVPAMSFVSPMYGPPGGHMPYMVDSRGAPVVPQIMGSSSALPPAFSQPPAPFIMSMVAAGTSSGSNGAGPSRHNFDLNSGLMIEGGNRENSGGLRQLFNHTQGRSVDEQLFLRSNNSQQASSSSLLGVKRQEPDSGWEPFPINFKHQQPPWK